MTTITVISTDVENDVCVLEIEDSSNPKHKKIEEITDTIVNQKARVEKMKIQKAAQLAYVENRFTAELANYTEVFNSFA